MIIESALLKLPEILVAYEDIDGLYEANIANLFSMAILTELNARNIDNPLEKIQIEKRYIKDENRRCDMYLDFTKVISQNNLLKYGIYQKNWIEFKYFGNFNRNKGDQTKSENVGKIAYDIYRLIKYTDNSQDGIYLVCGFNENPKEYLAFGKSSGDKRDWLYNIFKAGINEWEFNLAKEVKTIKKVFKDVDNIKMRVKTRTTFFEPLEKDVTGCFWGYLIQVLDGEITSVK